MRRELRQGGGAGTAVCEILRQFQFSQVVFDWTWEALRLSQAEKAEFHRKAIEKLNAQYLKLQNRIDQMYLDKLDGEIEEAFYQRHVSQWREEQDRIQEQIRQHQKADENYIEQGIKLIEIARNAYRFFKSKSKPERAELIRFILPDSQLNNGKIEPTFKPPFDIIWQLAQEAKQYHPDTKKQTAEDLSTACPTVLPLLDQLRTYCYTNRLEICQVFVPLIICDTNKEFHASLMRSF